MAIIYGPNGTPISTTNPLPVVLYNAAGTPVALTTSTAGKIQISGTGTAGATGLGAPVTIADAADSARLLGTAHYGYNRATRDAWENNVELTLLASAARTAQITTSTQQNYNARGVVLFLDVTVASGTGGLQPRFLGVDPISARTYTLNTAPTVVTATGTFGYILYPGAATSASQQTIQQVLPRNWQVVVQVGDASSYTYSLAACLIV